MKHEGRACLACVKLLYYVTLVFSLIYVIISPTPKVGTIRNQHPYVINYVSAKRCKMFGF